MSERERFEAWMSDDGKWPRAIERDSKGEYLLAKAASDWTVWQAARSGQAASGSQENARSDERTGWPPGLLQDDSRELSRALASKPDAMVHARDAVAKIGQPEAPTAAPLADEQATAFLLELRAVVAETMKRPGEAVPIPARVRTEVAKFMRDQPSVFDRLPYGEVVALAEFCGGVVAHPPARSGAGSEEAS